MHGLIPTKPCTRCGKPHKNPTLKTCVACREASRRRRKIYINKPGQKEKDRLRQKTVNKRYLENLTPEQKAEKYAQHKFMRQKRIDNGYSAYRNMTPEKRQAYNLKQRLWRKAHPEKIQEHKRVERQRIKDITKELGINQKQYARWMHLLFQAQVVWE